MSEKVACPFLLIIFSGANNKSVVKKVSGLPFFGSTTSTQRIGRGLPLDKQYRFAYEAIKKEWSVSTLDSAIKTTGDKKPKSASKKS
ncbi:MAG: hypothetical protein NTZ67_09590 [Gammaproteobacteria bacterium]|nr:hypothetical protein [Gammaproteobacteria bacterium]